MPETTQPPAAAAADADRRASERAKNRNLALRVATAVVLVPGVLALVWAGGPWLAAFATLAAVLGAREYYAMAMPGDSLRLPGMLVAGATPFFFLAGAEARLHWLWAALAAGALTWRLLRDAPVADAAPKVAHTLLGAVYAALVAYIIPLRQLGGGTEYSWGEGAAWVLLVMAMTWMNDTGAYFAGRFLGRHKLYPRISPAKTWEGFFGGMVASVGAAFLIRAVVGGAFAERVQVADCLALGVLAGIAGPVGDLVESMLKRSFNVKDSGQLLPGHGGVLDRIDALLFNAPVVYLYANLVIPMIR